MYKKCVLSCNGYWLRGLGTNFLVSVLFLREVLRIFVVLPSLSVAVDTVYIDIDIDIDIYIYIDKCVHRLIW